jgi:hypothetical protein
VEHAGNVPLAVRRARDAATFLATARLSVLRSGSRSIQAPEATSAELLGSFPLFDGLVPATLAAPGRSIVGGKALVFQR